MKFPQSFAFSRVRVGTNNATKRNHPTTQSSSVGSNSSCSTFQEERDDYKRSIPTVIHCTIVDDKEEESDSACYDDFIFPKSGVSSILTPMTSLTLSMSDNDGRLPADEAWDTEIRWKTLDDIESAFNLLRTMDSGFKEDLYSKYQMLEVCVKSEHEDSVIIVMRDILQVEAQREGIVRASQVLHSLKLDVLAVATWQTNKVNFQARLGLIVSIPMSIPSSSSWSGTTLDDELYEEAEVRVHSKSLLLKK